MKRLSHSIQRTVQALGLLGLGALLLTSAGCSSSAESTRQANLSALEQKSLSGKTFKMKGSILSSSKALPFHAKTVRETPSKYVGIVYVDTEEKAGVPFYLVAVKRGPKDLWLGFYPDQTMAYAVGKADLSRVVSPGKTGWKGAGWLVYETGSATGEITIEDLP